MFRLKMFVIMLTPNWLSTRFFMDGWGLFFKEEMVTLAIWSFIVGLLDWFLGDSLSCYVFHVGVVVLVRRILAGGICSSTKRLDGQTVVVTGCNAGIGRATAKALSSRGAKVVMACRNTQMAEKVASEIRKETGGKLVVMKLDLASLASIRAFHAELKEKIGKIHILINNAGVIPSRHTRTEDGFELQMGTNHLGHFLLTNLLLPSFTHSYPARIINVSSLGHAGGHIPLDDMNCERRKYDPHDVYYNTKLANILFTRQLAKILKGTNIQVFSLHPGGIHTSIGRHLEKDGHMSILTLFAPLLKTTVEGIQTTLYCALEAQQQEPYYYSDCHLGRVIKEATDDTMAEKLWKVSEEMVGLKKTSK